MGNEDSTEKTYGIYSNERAFVVKENNIYR